MPTREELLADVRAQREAKKLPELLKRDFATLSTAQGERRIRVMQWNMLAHGLCRGDDNFVLCSPDALLWENRSLHIIEEILTYNPTIACFQEVDRYDIIDETLARIGYSGCFLPKPNSPCLYTSDSVGPDGCAIFWKYDEVTMVKKENHILVDNGQRETNQVCLLCHFRPSDFKKKEEFVVATTHLKAKSGYEEMRRQQAQDIVQLLTKLPKTCPVILCGDFNSSPSEDVYTVIHNSPLGLASAYTLLSPDRKEPPYTTCKVRGNNQEGQLKICRTIDYMWYTTSSMVVAGLLKFPSLEEMGEKLLPSFLYPSDHLSLVCDFNIL